MQLENLQEVFQNDIKETCRIIVSYGIKGSGKTYEMMLMIKYFLASKIFDEFHLILPTFKYEKDNQYSFLKQYKNVFVYDTYHGGIAKELISNALKNIKQKKEKRVFFGIDDSTHMANAMKNCTYLSEIFTTSRHCKICLWMCMHASKSVLGKVMRCNIDILLVHKISNGALLQDLFDEFFSNMPIFNNNIKEFKDFMNGVWEHKNDPKDQNFLFVDCKQGRLDPAPIEWEQ